MVFVRKHMLLIDPENDWINLSDEVGPVGRRVCASEIPNM